MKGLGKITISILAIATILIIGVTVFANNTIQTGGVIITGQSDAPIIKAKWETVPSAGLDLDDNTEKPYTQVTPPLEYQGKKTIKYWVIVTDPNGFGDLTDYAYVDVYHPDGTFKYQVKLTEFYDKCPENLSEIQIAINELLSAYDKGLVTFGTGYTLQEVIAELEQCSAKLYVGEADMDYHQMCGEFDWTYECVGQPCTPRWTPSNLENGYKVNAYAFDKYNVKSEILTNYFEYICTPKIELDFDRINFGNVAVSSNKWVEGDFTFDTPVGPACAPGTAQGCRGPTIRNIGNTPVDIYVTFDDMNLGYSWNGGSKEWNVEWDARLGLEIAKYFKPYERTKIGKLLLCNTTKISFSIHVLKSVEPGEKRGNVTIEAVKAQ